MANVGNWPLLIKTVQHIMTLPEAWNQNVWVSPCGTHRCVAGWAAEFGGLQPVLLPIYEPEDPWMSKNWIFTGKVEHTHHFRQPSENPHADDVVITPEPLLTCDKFSDLYRHMNDGADYAPEAAAKVLGIERVDGLFESANTLGDILYIVNEWAEEDGVELPATFAVGEHDRNTTLPNYDDLDDDDYYEDEEY